MADDATIAALATAPGRAGIGIIRISGTRALPIVGGLCGCDVELPPRVATLGRWLDRDGSVLDQGLMLYFPAPHSYTGEDVIELHAHGSPVLLRALLARLFDLGCRPAQPGEFTRRAVAHGKMDLSQAEAVAACIDAATVRAGKQAQRQLQGDFGRKVAQWMDALTDVVAFVEACLDFADEDIPDFDPQVLRRRIEQRVIEPIERLLRSAPLGLRLFEGANIAIVGAPNVGKSSLMNALAGFERAIVSDVPGTTRDVLDVDFEIDGIPVRLIDTAGLREGSDAIEQEGIRRARQAAETADLVLFVADASRPETWSGWEEVSLRLMNKIDLAPDVKIPNGFVALSVQSGEGMDRLHQALRELLVDCELGGEDVFVTRERHAHQLRISLEHLREGVRLLSRPEHLDLVADQWRTAYNALGEILGIGDVEHILDRVFASFCIGK